MLPFKSTRLPHYLLLTSIIAATGCGSDDNDSDSSNTAPNEPLTLNILHINDHHSHLEQETQTLTIAGKETEFSIGGFARVAAKITERKQNLDNVLTLHAGDAITGTLYFSSFEGTADADLMNMVCFDAFALGNHEFDRGDEGLKYFLDALNEGNCNTPVLAANVKPAIGTPLAPEQADDYIQPYVIKEVNNKKVGIIGIDIANKTKGSSSPLATTEFFDEQETTQAMIDELQEQGINKIIVLSHYQYANEVNLAKNLRGVDVIVGGDSHTLLGDFSAYGLTPAGEYPTQVSNADGDPACVVQAWQYSHIVGELSVNFDKDGKVIDCNGTPHLLLDQPIVRQDDSDTDYQPIGTELAAIEAAIAADPQLSLTAADGAVANRLAYYQSQLDTFRNEVIGSATDNLCLERIPGQGRSSLPDCPASSTAQRGGDIANLVAQAFLYQSKTADVAIQNAGGVRVDVAKGNITIGDAYTLLPFSNTLVNLSMTGAEIRTVLNQAVDFAHDPKGSSGGYPYAAGLRWHVDMNRQAGERLYDIEVKTRDSDSWSALEDNETVIVVSNSFTAGGRDGYVTFGEVSQDGRVEDTFLDYAQSFVDYVRQQGTLGKPLADDYSTQSFTPAAQ